ncbi:hypothetical protein M422DRAFT_107674, partial [Sphaerobolus stellatus SS14]
GTCRNCTESANAEFRCRDCFMSPLFCQSCVLQTHIHLPYHRVERWNGQFFAATDLMELGHIVSLHAGSVLCPERPSKNELSKLTVINVNGVHKVHICFCYCRNQRPHFEQLLANGLWPATIKEPSTAFSFALLEDFHLHALISRKSGHDYWEVLCHKTSL